MSSKRRRKTPAHPLSQRLRTYGATYAANGQKERAEGLLQAADLVDEYFASRGGGSSVSVATTPDALEALAARVSKLEALLVAVSPREVKAAPRPPKPTKPRKMADGSAGDATLSTGEGAILNALSQLGGASSDELSAVVGYKATSLRTYLGNLRAAGLVESEHGKHWATGVGTNQASGEPVYTGASLLEWWLDGRLPAGEAKILSCVANAPSVEAEISAIGEATGFKATSVRTYVGSLLRRRLVVRTGRGKIALARLLLE